MAEALEMPKLSDTMEEGVIAAWKVQVGDEVEAGDIIAEVETDKATMEMESFFDGKVLYIAANEGDAVPLGSLIAIIGEAGEDYQTILQNYQGGGGSQAATEAAAAPSEPAPAPATDGPAAAAPAANGGGQPAAATATQGEAGRVATLPEAPAKGQERIKASPLARSLASEHNIDLRQLQGSGDGGRIVRRDVEAFLEQQQPAQPAQQAAPQAQPQPAVQDQAPAASMPAASDAYEEAPVSQMRKTIARRLSESKFTAPHFYLTMALDMDNAIAFRKQINQEAEEKISFNDILVKAAAAALRKHPKVNASWLGDQIRYYHNANIGVAVAVEEGLLVPVLRNVEAQSLSEIRSQTQAMAARAREKKLQPEEMQGNTFTISNLGMYGIEEFTAILNPPESCILAVGAIQAVPVVRGGQLVPGNQMRVTLSCDHRVVDGATGAEFLQTFKKMVENPMTMLL
jgi:pyruvate dehydrogenase E2 component (dihydrolipoamide acetyltransferase)